MFFVVFVVCCCLYCSNSEEVTMKDQGGFKYSELYDSEDVLLQDLDLAGSVEDKTLPKETKLPD